MKLKIVIHIGAIILFIFGAVIIHVVLNSDDIEFKFLTMILSRGFITDMGLVCIGIAFFIEFYLSFKPILIGKEEKGKND